MSEKMFNSYDDKPSPGADDLFLLWDNQESKVKNLKINNLSKYVENKFPKKLPNPHKLTFNGAVSAEYDGSGAVTVTIPEVSAKRITKITDGGKEEVAAAVSFIDDDCRSAAYTIQCRMNMMVKLSL